MGIGDKLQGAWERLTGQARQKEQAAAQERLTRQEHRQEAAVQRQADKERQVEQEHKAHEKLGSTRQKEAGPAERLLPHHSAAIRDAAAGRSQPQQQEAQKPVEREATRLENTMTPQPPPTPKMGGVSYVNPRASRPTPSSDNGQAQTQPRSETRNSPSGSQSAPDQAPAGKSLADHRRGGDQADRQPKQEGDKRPGERLIDQYRRPDPPDTVKTR